MIGIRLGNDLVSPNLLRLSDAYMYIFSWWGQFQETIQSELKITYWNYCQAPMSKGCSTLFLGSLAECMNHISGVDNTIARDPETSLKHEPSTVKPLT